MVIVTLVSHAAVFSPHATLLPEEREETLALQDKNGCMLWEASVVHLLNKWSVVFNGGQFVREYFCHLRV